jgi:hypothetical protein
MRYGDDNVFIRDIAVFSYKVLCRYSAREAKETCEKPQNSCVLASIETVKLAREVIQISTCTE